ncbi:hypothetical protein [Haloimpatiens lingqiaonensis]|uniref:hypothetical protein n=1 Tax=Haloimpatiens lingqiaonensis TaxID=1380675 RepID=UPI0010FF0807|nr:hypothetical protein [Haloimpatiens lingqiaonensis]
MGITISFSANTVFAASNWGEHWGMTLNKFCISGGEGGGKNMMIRHDDVTPRISLERIVGGPSYYAKLCAVNSNKQPRTNRVLAKQGGGAVTLTGNSMSRGYQYYVAGQNTVAENAYRWSYGRFEW